MLRDTGASIRIYHLAKNLASLGHEVHIVIPSNRLNTEKLIEGVIIHGVNGLYPHKVLKFISNLLGVLRPTSLFFHDFLFILRTCRIISKSDVTQIEQPWAAGLIIPLLTKIFSKSLVVDSHDVFQAFRTKKKALRKFLEIFVEKVVYKWANLILVVSEEDKKFLVKYGVLQKKILVIPNGVDTEVFKPSSDTSHIQSRHDLNKIYKVVFVGNMEYIPNQEAVRVIIQSLAPRVHSEIDNVKFVVVGRNPMKMNSPNIIFTGVVENVAEYLVASDVAIAPLFHGSGTRLKILEYFSCGLPVVSTRIGVEGLEVKNEENVIVEDDINEIAAKIVELLKDRALSMKLGKAARKLVVSKYDWRKIGEQLDKAYHSVLFNRKTRINDAFHKHMLYEQLYFIEDAHIRILLQ